MNSLTVLPLTTSASRTSTSGSTAASCCSMSAWIVLFMVSSPSSPYMKKAGQRPLSAPRPRGGAKRKLRPVLIAPEALCSGPCAVPVDAVVAPVRAQSGGQRERLPRVLRTAQLEQRAAEAEEGVVVGRRALDERLELGPGGLELGRAEVRAAERLTDRGLVRIEVAGLGQRDRRCREVAGLEQRRPALEEVVDVSHGHRVYGHFSAAGAAAPTTRAGVRAARRRAPARCADRAAGRAWAGCRGRRSAGRAARARSP